MSFPKAVQSIARKFRYSDYLKLPDDENLYEILKGELVVRTSPTPAHQRCSMRLSVILSLHVTQHNLGEIFAAPLDVILDPENPDPEILVKPDLLFVSKDRLNIITEENVEGSPDLIVEILSPSTANNDRDRKFKIYQEVKVLHYWIINPVARTLEEYVWESESGSFRHGASHAETEEFHPSLFPGLIVSLEALWS